MSQFSHSKYQAFKPVALPQRQWPSNTITHAPQWCSVDLRDGNQALIEPMSVEQKQRLFSLLIKLGFKQIEVGFPAASTTDYDFVRWLIETNQIPDDVSIQVLTQARPALIAKTFEALKGAKNAIVHLYNSTSKVQRDKVFKLDKAGIIEIAVKGARELQQHADCNPDTNWQFQYSPESFTGTELDFAVDICNAVVAEWRPKASQKIILNLPATVEMSTPNIYADQIEWFIHHIDHREDLIISQHTHNDRGCGIAAAELGQLAGADRVEGTLLGNGERTGNMDIVTMAMNLYSQGIDPQLNLADVDEIVQVVKFCTQLPVHPRHPYVGELVFTAFSGSHQDAIKKCLDIQQPEQHWDVAYLPIDPADLGRDYQEVIRINSQSGKGGIAYILDKDYGIQLPRWALIEFSAVVQQDAEQSGEEISPDKIWQLFQRQYLQQQHAYQLVNYQVNYEQQEQVQVLLQRDQEQFQIKASGNGALAAFVNGLAQQFNIEIEVLDYNEHALSKGAEAEAVCYIQAKIAGKRYLGVAIDKDILTASLKATLCALNQELCQQPIGEPA
ncbi:2-isopropylmalate synthase [Agarivorans sp. Toyoura001]|uniref:2-isopropylmalate synthase n=1 Tax=Agarivorans sp. Toyoura001 TaxID=2283141 RepID=UPI0010E3565E|nr:2-isopropylmalate synthase [Agarivorans sp. Toyoura001]GDY26664.1 2-isopropylmalate synthase [Agarivorans sp. Toyoura001]